MTTNQKTHNNDNKTNQKNHKGDSSHLSNAAATMKSNDSSQEEKSRTAAKMGSEGGKHIHDNTASSSHDRNKSSEQDGRNNMRDNDKTDNKHKVH